MTKPGFRRSASPTLIATATVALTIFTLGFAGANAVYAQIPANLEALNGLGKPVKADEKSGLKEGFKVEHTYGVEWGTRLPSSAIKINLSGLSPLVNPSGKYEFYPDGDETQVLPLRGGVRGLGETPLYLIYLPPTVYKRHVSGPGQRQDRTPLNDPIVKLREDIFSTQPGEFPDIFEEGIPVDERARLVPIRYIERDPLNPNDVYLFYDEFTVSHQGRLFIGVLAKSSPKVAGETRKAAEETRDKLAGTLARLREGIAILDEAIRNRRFLDHTQRALKERRDQLKTDTAEHKAFVAALDRILQAPVTEPEDVTYPAVKVILETAEAAANAEKQRIEGELAKPFGMQVLVVDPKPITPARPQVASADSGLKVNASVNTRILPEGGAIFPVNPAGEMEGDSFLNPGGTRRFFDTTGETTTGSANHLQLPNLRVNHMPHLLPGRSDLEFDLLLSSENRDINSKIATIYTPFQHNLSYYREPIYTVIQRDEGIIWTPQIRWQISQRYLVLKSNAEDRDETNQLIFSPLRIQSLQTVSEFLRRIGIARIKEKVEVAFKRDSGTEPDPRWNPSESGEYLSPRRYNPNRFPGTLQLSLDPYQIRYEWTQFRTASSEGGGEGEIFSPGLYLPTSTLGLRWNVPLTANIGAQNFASTLNVSYNYYRFLRSRNNLLQNALNKARVPVPVDLPVFTTGVGLLEISLRTKANLGIPGLGDTQIQVGYRSGLPSSAGFLNPTAQNTSQFFFGLVQ